MQPPLSREWSTPVALVAVTWALAAAALVWLIVADTAIDRVFIGALTLVLVAAASYGGIVRPRLAVDAEGVAVRGLRGVRRWPWTGVAVRVHQAQRFGRTVETLELDLPNDELIILSKLDLGDDPREVAEELERFRT